MLRKSTHALLAAVASTALVAGSASAASTTSLGSGSWTDGGTWDSGVPTGTIDVVIGAGHTVSASNTVGSYSGTLTLQSNAVLDIISGSNPNPADMAFDGATAFILADGARVRTNFKTETLSQNWTITGIAGLASTNNSANNHNHILAGAISGDTWTTLGRNHEGITYTATNNFSAYIADSNDRHAISFNAAGALSGDLTVNAAGNGRSGVIRFTVDNAVASGVSMDLNGAGWNASTGGFGPYSFYGGSSYNIDLNGTDQTVDALTVNGVVIGAGVYSLGDPNTAWLGDRAGGGTLTVIPEPSSLALLGLGGLLIARRRRG